MPAQEAPPILVSDTGLQNRFGGRYRLTRLVEPIGNKQVERDWLKSSKFFDGPKKEAASCPTMETNEEVGEQRFWNVGLPERNTEHDTKDEPYFAHKYLSSDSVAGKTCTCGHVFGKTAGNYQAWTHFTNADHTKPSVHEREIAAKAMAPAKKPCSISRFFNAQSSTTAAPTLASPVDAPAPLPALLSSALPLVVETVCLNNDTPAAGAFVTAETPVVRLAPPFLMKSPVIDLSIRNLT